jgi:hypothetical protein
VLERTVGKMVWCEGGDCFDLRAGRERPWAVMKEDFGFQRFICLKVNMLYVAIKRK